MKNCRCHLMDNSCEVHLGKEMRSDFRERVGEAIHSNMCSQDIDGYLAAQIDAELIMFAVIKAMHEPDPNAVAKAADQLGMDATKVAAVWIIMIEEMGK